MFLWISFNAAYSARHVDPETEAESQHAFFRQVLDADRDRILSTALRESQCLIVALLESKQIYWRRIRNQQGDRTHGDWNAHFRRETNDARSALEMAPPSGSATVLDVVFDRLTALRNLLIHGQISWRSRIADPVVETASDFLATVLPVFVRLMIENRDADWDLPTTYPDIYRQDRIESKR